KTVLVSMLAPPFALVARPDVAAPAQLRGRVIGITSLGATNEQVTRLVLQHFGLEAQRDVQLIAVGDAPVQYEALRLGQIDPAIGEQVYTLMAPVFSADGTVERGPIELLIEQAREAAEVAAPVPFEQVADTTLVPEALRELGRPR